MGDPRKLKAKAETPRRVWDAERISSETALRREYGLKNARELWTVLAELKRMRRTARHLLSLGDAGRAQGLQIVAKLQRLGIAKGEMRLEDVLGLGVRDFLDRRLQSHVIRKGLARTPAQARQLVTHGFISVGGRRVTIPSYVVTAGEEPTVSYFKAIDISVPEDKPKQAPRREHVAAPEPAAAEKPAEKAPATAA